MKAALRTLDLNLLKTLDARHPAQVWLRELLLETSGRQGKSRPSPGT